MFQGYSFWYGRLFGQGAARKKKWTSVQVVSRILWRGFLVLNKGVNKTKEILELILSP